MKNIFLFFAFLLFSNNFSVFSQNSQSHLMVIASILPENYIKSNKDIFFTIQLGAYKKDEIFLADLENIVVYKENGINRFRIGEFPTYNEAKEYKKMIRNSCKDAFIVPIKNGKRISISEALK